VRFGRRAEDTEAAEIKVKHPWRWFIGDKAMCIKNDYKNEVYNGELGIVIDVNAKSKLLTVEYPDISVVCNYGYKENKDEGIMPLGHLQPAYVSTIHKSQGSEYPVVVLVIAKENTIMLKRRLIYTAITRAKNACIIIFENEALERSLQNYMDQPRMTNLVDKICLFPKHIYEEDLKCVNDMPLF
jgi:exodeoxyribonuclease V alpha subunit